MKVLEIIPFLVLAKDFSLTKDNLLSNNNYEPNFIDLFKH